MSYDPFDAILSPLIVEGWRIRVYVAYQSYSLSLTYCDVAGALLVPKSQIGLGTEQNTDLPLIFQGLFRDVLVVSSAAQKGGIMVWHRGKGRNCCEYFTVGALIPPDNF